MPRFFNTAGPNQPERHYTLPLLARLPRVRRLIDQGLYFVLHAPRQVGKTTSLFGLARELTAEGAYVAVLVSMEVGAPFSGEVGAAELAVLDAWRRHASAQLPAELRPAPWPEAPPGSRIGAALEAWARAAPRPLVIFLDEIDALRGDALSSVLRQVRDGYGNRPAAFPHALALVGLRDVRDDKFASGGGEQTTTSSPFNIKADSLTPCATSPATRSLRCTASTPRRPGRSSFRRRSIAPSTSPRASPGSSMPSPGSSPRSWSRIAPFPSPRPAWTRPATSSSGGRTRTSTA